MSSRKPGVPEQNFSPFRVSPSRINAYVTCGEAFRRYYIENEPKQRSGSAALFGQVLHLAMENWTPDRSNDLLALVRSSWTELTKGTVVADFLKEYASLSVEAIKQEHAIREAWKAKGKESKAPRMTKEWKESSIGKKLRALMPKWEQRLTEGSPWQFNEYDPIGSLYDESLVMSRRIQRRLGHLPPSLYTEFECEEPWEGFTIKGYIDSIEPLLNGAGELVAIGVLDYKTYRKNPTPQIEGDGEGDGAEKKDYRQLVMYDVAVRELLKRGALKLPVPIDNIETFGASGVTGSVPLYVGIDYLRTGERRWWKMGQADHDLLKQELQMYSRGIEGGVFLPAAKGTNPAYCDYGESCCMRRAAPGTASRVTV
jgi:hypothetical protein